MKLVLSEEHQILKETAAEFVRSKTSLKRIRALRDSRDRTGFSRDLWHEMAALGWVGIVIPETYGGSGFGYSHLMVVMEELGRGLMPEPMVPAVLGSAALVAGGNERQKRALLPAIAKGETLVALGYQEGGSRFDPCHVTMRAERTGGAWRLRGEKRLVLAAQAADSLIVSARTGGAVGDRSGVTLFLLDRKAAGLTVTQQSLVDSRPAAIVRLDGVEVDASAIGVEVDASAIVGEVDLGAAVLEAAIDRGTAALVAEMLGSMLAAFDMTLAYLKTRKQFGVLIGTFQALKHRAAVVYTETELSRSAVMTACFALDEDDARAPELVSLAKARLSDAFVLTANEAIQMHGGIGMTDEHDIGFFLKRARAAEMTFGDAAWHRRRYAEMHGY
jgi:alkylation response protein AidB-like acyl-CoA dehydrogenase